MRWYRSTLLIKRMAVIMVILQLFSGCRATISIFPTDKSTMQGIKVGLRQGTIFSKQYPITNISLPGINLTKRFTPTREDIQKSQTIMAKQVYGYGKANVDHYKNFPAGPSFNYYFMQYVGFINAKGEKILYINFIWNKRDAIDKMVFDSEFKRVSGGGNHYWQLVLNLTTQNVVDLYVNDAN